MYSPKLPDDLIPVLYHQAKAERIPMTKLIDKIVRGYLRSDGRKDGDGSSRVAERHEKRGLADGIEIDYQAILVAREEAEDQRLVRIENDKVKYESKFPEYYKGGCNEGTN